MKIREYNQCVDQYADGVYRFILKHLKDEDRAKDVVQDAFLKMWEKKDQIEDGKFKSYLFTTAYHTMIDLIRRNKKVQYRDELSMHSSYSEINPPDLKTLLNEALERLPEIQKTVILLRDYEGYNYEEIGEICELNPSQVKVYIYRARVSLKSYIRKPELVI